MTPFRYQQAADAAQAVRLFPDTEHASYLGGGTNLVDLMREDIEHPDTLIDISAFGREIEDLDGGGLRIAAGAKNTAVATHMGVRTRFPMLVEAILSGASAQVRNMATVAGNIMQRTRCYYFYDHAARCNKRERGAGCDALEGFNRMHAILGASPSCVATHPSDMCVALAALDASVQLQGPQGTRTLRLIDLHRLPGGTPDVDTNLAPGELITAVEIPALACAGRSIYRKVRDRSSFAFALVSLAAALDVDEQGKVREARLALGGVAHKPWRAHTAEQILRGEPVDERSFRRAADAELAPAAGLAHNAFKIELAKRVIVSGLMQLASQREMNT
jgi:xanthine dehydrogenase YagS FAD-binding subunit